MKETTDTKNFYRTTKIFQPKLLKLKDTKNILTNENTVDLINYSNNIKLQIYSEKSKKKLEEYDVSENNSIKEDESLKEKVISYYKNPFKYMDYIVEKYLNEKLKDRNTLKQDINKMISSLKEINSKTSKDQKEFFINEIEKVNKNGEVTSEKTSINLLENFNYFKEEIIKKLESKDSIIQDLLNNQQIIIHQQQQQMQLQNQQQLITKEEVLAKSFKEESVKTIQEEPVNLKDDLVSEPIDQNKVLKELLKEDSKQYKYTLGSNNDMKNYVLNNPKLELFKENIERKFIEMIEGGKLKAPQRKYISEKDLTLNNLNPEEVEYSKNILDIQMKYEKFKNEVNVKTVKNLDKTIKQTQSIYKELLDKTNKNIDKINKDMKVTDELLSYVKNKVDKEFNEEVIKSHFEKMSRCTKNMGEIHKDMNTQAYDFHRERFMQIKEENKKVNEEVDLALKNLNIDLNNEVVETNENQTSNKIDIVKDKYLEEEGEEPHANDNLSEEKIEELYKKYKINHKNIQKLNNQYINPVSANYNFKKNKNVRSTISIKKK